MCLVSDQEPRRLTAAETLLLQDTAAAGTMQMLCSVCLHPSAEIQCHWCLSNLCWGCARVCRRCHYVICPSVCKECAACHQCPPYGDDTGESEQSEACNHDRIVNVLLATFLFITMIAIAIFSTSCSVGTTTAVI